MRNALPMMTAAMVIAVVPAPSFAHDIADPRVVVIVPGPSSIEIRLNDMEKPGDPSSQLRLRFDGNRDGKIGENELEDLTRFLLARATHNLKVWQRGERVELVPGARQVRGADGAADSTESLSIDAVLRADLIVKDGPASVTIADWRPDGHPVRMAVIAGAGANLVSASIAPFGLDGAPPRAPIAPFGLDGAPPRAPIAPFGLDGAPPRAPIAPFGLDGAPPRAPAGSLDASRGTVVGIELDRKQTLVLEWVAAPAGSRKKGTPQTPE